MKILFCLSMVRLLNDFKYFDIKDHAVRVGHLKNAIY